MKTNFIITASLALFAAVTTTFANPNAPVPELPAFTITVDRHTDAEKAIDASLAEFRQTARSTPAITAQPALPLNVAGKAAPKPAPLAATSPTLRVAVKA